MNGKRQLFLLSCFILAAVTMMWAAVGIWNGFVLVHFFESSDATWSSERAAGHVLWWLFGGAFGGVLLITGILGFNRLSRARNELRRRFSDIDVLLSRRLELVPQLVSLLERHLKHENQTLQDVISARGNAMSATSRNERVYAESQLTDALGPLMVLFEQYPKLQTDGHASALHRELIDTENKIAAMRFNYNGVVKNYNDLVDSFPTLIVAISLDFENERYL